jgi:hypothetical protein
VSRPFAPVPHSAVFRYPQKILKPIRVILKPERIILKPVRFLPKYGEIVLKYERFVPTSGKIVLKYEMKKPKPCLEKFEDSSLEFALCSVKRDYFHLESDFDKDNMAPNSGRKMYNLYKGENKPARPEYRCSVQE